MKLITTLIGTVLSFCIAAQGVRPSNTYVRTCLNDVECASINSSSYLFYDEGKGKFYIMLDFNRMRTGVDSVDFWLQDLSDSYYYFKAPLMPADMPGLSNYNQRNLKLTGQAHLNGVWKNQTIDVSFFRADNDMQSNTIDADKLESVRVNLSLTIVPKEFGLHKKPTRLTNTIFVGISSGRINLLKQEHLSLLGDAYTYGD